MSMCATLIQMENFCSALDWLEWLALHIVLFSFDRTALCYYCWNIAPFFFFLSVKIRCQSYLVKNRGLNLSVPLLFRHFEHSEWTVTTVIGKNSRGVVHPSLKAEYHENVNAEEAAGESTMSVLAIACTCWSCDKSVHFGLLLLFTSQQLLDGLSQNLPWNYSGKDNHGGALMLLMILWLFL